MVIDEVVELEQRLGLAGASVLAPVPIRDALTPLERARLMALHLRKIDAADVVVVANVCGYTEPGAADEIAYAMRSGKHLMFLEEPAAVDVSSDEYAEYLGRTRLVEVRPGRELPQGLARGAVVRMTTVDDGERTAWFRAADVLRFKGVAETVASVDPRRVRPGNDLVGLTQHLCETYPDSDDSDYLAVELEFLGEQHDIQAPALPEQRAALAVVLARGPEGTVALERRPSGALGLPGELISPDEYPATTAARLATALFSGASAPASLIAVDTEQGGSFLRYVFDAGTVEAARVAQAIKSGEAACGQLVFADPDQVQRLVEPRTARVIQAVLDVQPGGVALLEHGYGMGRRPVWEWHETTRPPEGVPVTQAGVWVFDRDGRVVLQHRMERGGAFALPAGSPEPRDRDWLATAAREAFEESQILIDHRRARLIGFQVTYSGSGYPNGLAQARYVAPVLAYHPIAADADPKLTSSRAPYRRYLTDIRRAAQLLDWGPHGTVQTHAAEQAAREMGLPVDRPSADGYRDHGDTGLLEYAREWELML